MKKILLNELYKNSGVKLSIIFLYFLLGVLISTLFVENLIFSSELGVLGFRGINDVAFQAVLRSTHEAFINGNFPKIFVINDYGYGWVYWFVLSLISYPFYLISTYFQIDWPLIVFPREMSLLFGVLTLWFLRKTVKNLTGSELICAFCALIFALFPSFGYFSLEFGTTNAVMFFSALSLFFILRARKIVFSTIVQAGISFAIAASIKPIGILIAPILLLVLFFRARELGFNLSVKEIFISILLTIFTLVFLTNPGFIVAPFDGKILADYLKVIEHFSQTPQQAFFQLTLLERLYKGLFNGLLSLIIYVTLLVGLVLYGWDDSAVQKKGRVFKGLITVGVIVLLALMLGSVIKVPVSIGSYFTSISFIAIFGVIGLSRLRYGRTILIIIFSAQIYVVLDRAWGQYVGTSDAWNHANYFVIDKNSTQDIISAKQINDCLKIHDAKGTKHIFVDHTLKTFINPLSYRGTCISYAWNNFSSEGKYCPTEIDYIILDINAAGALPSEEFERIVKTADSTTGNLLLKDRSSREILGMTGTFAGQKFKLICSGKKANVYSAE